MKKYYFLVSLIVVMFMFLVLVLVISARTSDNYFNPVGYQNIVTESSKS
jgi:hypothetical protein